MEKNANFSPPEPGRLWVAVVVSIYLLCTCLRPFFIARLQEDERSWQTIAGQMLVGPPRTRAKL